MPPPRRPLHCRGRRRSSRCLDGRTLRAAAVLSRLGEFGRPQVEARELHPGAAATQGNARLLADEDGGLHAVWEKGVMMACGLVLYGAGQVSYPLGKNSARDCVRAGADGPAPRPRQIRLSSGSFGLERVERLAETAFRVMVPHSYGAARHVRCAMGN